MPERNLESLYLIDMENLELSPHYISVEWTYYFKIVPAESYSKEDLNYHDDDCRANREQQDKNARPSVPVAAMTA